MDSEISNSMASSMAKLTTKTQLARPFGSDLTNVTSHSQICPSPPSKRYRKCKFIEKAIKSEEFPEKKSKSKLTRSNTQYDQKRCYDEEDSKMLEVTFIEDNRISRWDKLDLICEPESKTDLFCIPYKYDIYQTFIEEEDKIFGKNRTINFYNKNVNPWIQKDVTYKMRLILIDWLIGVHRKFKLLLPTLHLTVELIDRILSKKQLLRNELQLYGCACLWISSKYHEIYAPEMSDFIYISDKAFTKDELKDCESTILKELGYSITFNTPLSWIELFSKVLTYPIRAKFVQRYGSDKKSLVKRRNDLCQKTSVLTSTLNYLIEHCLLDYELINHYRKSMVVAAAVAFTLFAFKIKANACDNSCPNIDLQQYKRSIWSKDIEEFTGYKLKQLEPLIIRIDQLRTDTKHKATRNKYGRAEYQRVSCIDFHKDHTIQKCFGKS